MQGHAVAVARQADIGPVAVHPRRGEHMGAVHRHALRFVDRGRVAMIDVRIILGIEGDVAAIVGAHGHALRANPLDRAQGAVLDAQPALIAQEHDAVAAGELALAAISFDRHVHAQFARVTQPPARGVIELAQKFEGAGVAAIIYTDIDRDGILAGINWASTLELARAVSIPVIASGGLASMEDIKKLASPECSTLEGAISGRALYDGRIDPGEALAILRTGA